MATQRYKCTNFGNCAKADSGDFIDLQPGDSPVCPICGKPLTFVPTAARRSPIGGLVALIVLLLLALLGWKLFSGHKGAGGGAVATNTSPGDFNAAPGATTPSATPTVNPGDALMYFERSDEQWLKTNADTFNQQNPNSPKIVLDYRGSREGKQDILYGKGQPVLWNPADTYWVDKLNQDWKSVGKHSDDVTSDSRTIVSTRFVLVMWQDKAKVFTAAMQTPHYRGMTWLLLSDIATKGWQSVGGPASWGKLKLAQSNPIKSNGGQTTLALMFNEYAKTHPGVTPASPTFLTFMRGIEGSVIKFEDTTSKGLESMVNGGEGQYDMTVAYEINAVSAVDKGTANIQVVYPDPTVEVDFPAATLKAPWVTSDETHLAGKFVDFLLTRDVQQQAVTAGFRPALSDMRSAVDDAFSQGPRAKAGLQSDPATVVRPVSTRDIDGLLYQWYKIYGSGGSAPS